jgi:hypothetical protein
VLKLKTAQVIERQSIRMQVDPTNPEEPLIPLDQPNYKDAAYYKASITDVRSVSAYSGATQNVFSDYNYEAKEGQEPAAKLLAIHGKPGFSQFNLLMIPLCLFMTMFADTDMF